MRKHLTSKRTEWEFSKTTQTARVARSLSTSLIRPAKSQHLRAICSRRNCISEEERLIE
jgi:hypothetical protein